ncbi:hypothetical protein MNBD_ACTINO02-2987 [hydrothermal vent metagenome]|uniref:CcmH/CycL/Ccl2/NrfF N-terminal domain-containing protein n=1 Tax=hydrothermal vent metagenome TaxID=652676 RepID=A0A3B0S913_9ZZZZ
MRELRRILRIALPIAAVLIMVLALRPAATIPSDEQRVDALSKTLVCPVCRGLSLDQSPSKVALDGIDFITEKIAEGWTDDEVYEFWASSYGDKAILDPGRSGIALVLWGVPTAMVLLGGYVIYRRRRGGANIAVDSRVVEQRVEQVKADLADLDRQIADGELDEETAAKLRDVYEREGAALAEKESDTSSPTGVESRIKMGAAAIGIVAGVIGIVAIVGLNNPQSNATEGVVADVLSGNTRNLDDVTNEEMEVIVANNPDVLAMRRALARRYFDAGEFSKALDHFLYILEREKDAESLATVGWMTFLSDNPDTAASFLDEALKVNPDYLTAQVWLALVRLEGLNDPAGAVPLFEQALRAPELPDETRTVIEEALALARERINGGTG